jgi:phage terminase small subunit
MTHKVVKLPRPERHPKPPPSLGAEGAALWARIVAEFEVGDPAALSVLQGACEARDLADECRRAIETEGLMLSTPGGGVKENPLSQRQLQALALSARLLSRLGCLEAPPRQALRPVGGVLR